MHFQTTTGYVHKGDSICLPFYYKIFMYDNSCHQQVAGRTIQWPPFKTYKKGGSYIHIPYTFLPMHIVTMKPWLWSQPMSICQGARFIFISLWKVDLCESCKIGISSHLLRKRAWTHIEMRIRMNSSSSTLSGYSFIRTQSITGPTQKSGTKYLRTYIY